MNRSPVLIGLDWGTSRFRAYLIVDDGAVVGRVEESAGILSVPDGGFATAVDKLIGHWLARHEALPILACGMVGSRQGWEEAPYLDCPANGAGIASHLIAVELRAGRRVHIVPGLTFFDANCMADVMRGEETQIIGALHPGQSARQWFVLPGTHSKWAEAGSGGIERFATFMTGELYDTLRKHSILGRMAEGNYHDADAFRRGVEYAAELGGLLRHLFSARSLPLLDKLPRSSVASYLSGLLIGAEIEGAIGWLDPKGRYTLEVMLIGGASLIDHYANALIIKGIQPKRGGTDAVVQGLLRVARLKALL